MCISQINMEIINKTERYAMEYVMGTPYFCKVDKLKQYPYIDKDTKCDVLIIGGGIMGSIANYHISSLYDTICVDSGILGHGCTSCSTALLEYNLDDDAKTLKGSLSDEDIVKIYKIGQMGLNKLHDFVNTNGNKCEYAVKDVLMYSNNTKDNASIEEEYEFLRTHGFGAILIKDRDNPYNFEISRGILIPNGGAEVNPYLLTKQLFELSKNQNKIYENTKVVKIEKLKNSYICTTNLGYNITAKKVVLSTGFNFELIGTPLCATATTYTIVTNKLKDFGWNNDALIQDWANPYHYMRLLPDKRIIFGGEDTERKFDAPIDQKLATKKYDTLLKTLQKIFPSIANEIKAEYTFCGAFGSTKNNIGYIGRAKDNLYYFYSMGANGIVNAFYAIDIILRQLRRDEPNYNDKFFDPNRLN